LPLGALLGVAWPVFRQRIAAGGPLPVNPVRVPYAFPSRELIWWRSLELLDLASWAVPGLVVLAIFGWTLLRREAPPRARELATLLGASAACLLVGYFPLVYHQGHGWSYRHFHGVWAVLPLLGATPLLRPYAHRARWVPLAGFLALGSLVAGNALRAVEVHRFIEMRRAELPAIPAARPLACFVALERHFYLDDQVRNDPFLRTDLLLLGSRGREADAALLSRRFPGARAVPSPTGLACWRLPDGAIAALRAPG
jgi:hypothetical protein